MSSSFYIVASSLLVVLLASQALAADLIELNDANKNQLHLEVSKALEVVQAALTSGFQFERVRDAQNFVSKCNYLESAMNNENDDAFQGLAGKIKNLLKDEQLQSRCHIGLEKFDNYVQLDEKEVGSFYLSKKRLQGLIALGEKLNQDPTMKLVLGYLYTKKSHGTGEQLLQHAAEDTSIFFGELDKSRYFTTRYHTGCAISTLKPICKLVRGVPNEDVSAYGKDVQQFSEALRLNTEAVVAQHVQASGVSLDQLKSQCDASDFSIYPIQQVNNYLKAGYLDENQIREQMTRDSELSFYYALYNLCAWVRSS